MEIKIAPPCSCTDEAICYTCQFSAMALYTSCIVCGSWLGEEVLTGQVDYLCATCRESFGVVCRVCGELFVAAEAPLIEGCCKECY